MRIETWLTRNRRPEPGSDRGEDTGPKVPEVDTTIEPTTVFSAAELQGARERLTAGDGLHRMLARTPRTGAREERVHGPRSPPPARPTRRRTDRGRGPVGRSA